MYFLSDIFIRRTFYDVLRYNAAISPHKNIYICQQVHFHGLVMTAIVAELSAVKRNRADAPGGAASALSLVAELPPGSSCVSLVADCFNRCHG